jgi:hypothetical protein
LSGHNVTRHTRILGLSRILCGLWHEREEWSHRRSLERRLRERLDALGPAPRAELLMLPDLERTERILSEPSGSASSGRTRRAAPSPSEDRLRGGPDRFGRCSSGCW